jgi:hypothetical protein
MNAFYENDNISMTSRGGISAYSELGRHSSHVSDAQSIHSYKTYRSNHLSGSGAKGKPEKGN